VRHYQLLKNESTPLIYSVTWSQFGVFVRIFFVYFRYLSGINSKNQAVRMFVILNSCDYTWYSLVCVVMIRNHVIYGSMYP